MGTKHRDGMCSMVGYIGQGSALASNPTHGSNNSNTRESKVERFRVSRMEERCSARRWNRGVTANGTRIAQRSCAGGVRESALVAVNIAFCLPPLLLLKRGLSSLTGTRSSFLAKVRIIVSGSAPKKYLELVGIWSKDRHGIPGETAEGRVSTTSKLIRIRISIKEAGRWITRHDEWPGH